MPLPLLAIAVVGGIATVAGGIFGASKARRDKENAQSDQARQQRIIDGLKADRATIENPYKNTKDLSGLATDLSGMLSNPYASLGVATQAAEIQMEQTDMALANTLDTLRSTGASAGGATALAQAALQSKKGVAANIEQQEAQNDKLRAQGEQQLQSAKMSEQQRLQSIAISEGQRVQAADAAGKQFEFNAQEQRTNMDLNRAAGLQDRAMQMEAQANQAQAASNASIFSGVGNLAGSLIGAHGQALGASGGTQGIFGPTGS
jgi:hypothetical protein